MGLISGQRLEWTKVRTGGNTDGATNFNKIKIRVSFPSRVLKNKIFKYSFYTLFILTCVQASWGFLLLPVCLNNMNIQPVVSNLFSLRGTEGRRWNEAPSRGYA